MTETQAVALAEQIRISTALTTRIRREGHYFVVAVETSTETVIVRDDVDWRWLHQRLDPAGAARDQHSPADASVTVRLEGFHAVKHALRFAPDLVHAVTVADLDKTRDLAQRLAPDIAEALLQRATPGDVEHPTGVSATASRPVEDRTVLRTRRTPLIVLDDPRHPGNAGAVIRVAAAAGASGVALTGSLDPWHAAVVRGSAGLHYALPVLRTTPADLVGPVLVLDADGDPLTTIPNDAILVVGSERAGVRLALRDQADAILRLPMRAGVSSLNLATATAAVLYSWRLRCPD